MTPCSLVRRRNVRPDVDPPSPGNADIDLAVIAASSCADQSEDVRVEPRIRGQLARVERVLDKERFTQVVRIPPRSYIGFDVDVEFPFRQARAGVRAPPPGAIVVAAGSGRGGDNFAKRGPVLQYFPWDGVAVVVSDGRGRDGCPFGLSIAAARSTKPMLRSLLLLLLFLAIFDHFSLLRRPI